MAAAPVEQYQKRMAAPGRRASGGGRRAPPPPVPAVEALDVRAAAPRDGGGGVAAPLEKPSPEVRALMAMGFGGRFPFESRGPRR
mgnify:CR=1 FL=1